MNKLFYIEYSYPDPENAAVVNTWNSMTGEKPKKKQVNRECIFVYDIGPIEKPNTQGTLINERPWNGEE